MLLALPLASGAIGCGGSGGSHATTSSSSSTGTFCVGGFVRMVDGKPTCEGLCKASLCTNPGNVCVDNLCALPCTSTLDCQVGQVCTVGKDDESGKAISTCQPSGKAAIGTPCPQGKECASLMACGDGTPCPANGSCAVGMCQALVCLSSGVGDADAYCTINDCHADGDCPQGYWCQTIRDPHQICGKPVPPTLCGKTTDPCVDLSQNAANGTTFADAPFCTQRNQCRIRKDCDPCMSDTDCGLVAGQHCVQGNCAHDCTSDASCLDGFKCSMGACVPRSGSCTAMAGTGKFCDTCREQTDCGSGLLCGRAVVDGLRTCLDENPTACTMDTDCPIAPSGLHAMCADERIQVTAGQAGYHTCIFAPYFSTNKFGCWQVNAGGTCYSDSECISGTCKGGDLTTQVLGFCQ